MLSADCHKLLAKIQAHDQEVKNDNGKLYEAKSLNAELQKELQKLQEKLSQCRDDFKNLNKLRKQENEHRSISKLQSESYV